MTITDTTTSQPPTPLATISRIADEVLAKRALFGDGFTFHDNLGIHDPSHPNANHHGYRNITRGEYVKALRLIRREQEREARNARLNEADRIAAALAKEPTVAVPSMSEAPDPKLVEADRIARELAKDREALQRRRQDAIAAINRIARSR